MKLNELCEVYSGFAFKEFHKEHNGIPVIKIGNIKNDGTIDLEDCSYTVEIANDKFISKNGDIYIALSGATTGKIGLMKRNGYYVNQRVGIVRLKNNNIPIPYLCYFLQSKTKQILSDAVGAAQPNISPKDIAKYSFPIKSKDQMVSISEELTKIDTAIKLNEIQLLLLDELIKSRFIEMFGTIDLSEERDDWIELEKLAKIYTGTTPSSTDESNWNGDILWITPAEMNSDSFYIYDTVRKITEKGRKSKSLDIMPVNTVLLSTRAPIGKVGIVGKPMACNQGFKNFECGERLNPVFLFTILKANTEYLNSLGSGTTFLEVSKSRIAKLKVPVPEINKQKEFETFVSQVDKSKFVVHSRYFL